MLAALFLLLLPGQLAPQKPVAPAAPVTSAAAASTVHIADAHLTYSLPPGVPPQAQMGEDVLKAERNKATDDNTKKAAGCTSLAILGMDATENFRIASIIRIDGKCLGVDVGNIPLDRAATGTMQEALARLAPGGKISPPAPYKLGTHDAVAVRGTVHVDQLGLDFQSIVSCTASNNNMLCWQFVALKRDVVDGLAAQPVQFDGEASTPVVAAGVLSVLKVEDAPKP